VALVAVLTGCLLAYKVSFPPERRSYSVGIANASVLIDTPKSQVVEVAPKGSDTLGDRANVLANLMVDGEIKNTIADRVGVPPKRLKAWVESRDNPGPPLTRKSLSYKTGVALTSDMAQLPIVKVETTAPTVSQAIRLANAAVEGLSDYLNSKAAVETIADTRRLRVSPLGTAQGHAAARGPGRIMAIGAMIFVFIAGCAALLIVAALVRGWRAAAASELESDGSVLVAAAQAEDEGEDEATIEPKSADQRRGRAAALRA
jgi:hypothetical protein